VSRWYYSSSTYCWQQQEKPTLSNGHPKKNSNSNNNSEEPNKEEKHDTTSTTITTPSSDVLLNHWLEQLQSIPNMITVARIASTPLLAYWIITDATWPAILGCSIAAASDALDGYLARHCHMSTTLGTYLDPFGTKLKNRE
jgi:cardiolipin synthase